MASVTDFVLLGGTLTCAFGAAFALQKATLELILRAMSRHQM